MPPGCFLEVARTVKEFFSANQIRSNAGAEVPVVGVGKLGYPDLAEAALRGRLCDMVMLGRPLLADPEWPNKAYAGQVEDIRPCIGCQEGCLNEFVEGAIPNARSTPVPPSSMSIPPRRPRPRRLSGSPSWGPGPPGWSPRSPPPPGGIGSPSSKKAGKSAGA